MSAYLDHASAWPLSEAVRREMDRWTHHVGSPMALHEHARGPAEAIELARASVARLIGWAPETVIFTAGATEARNLAIKGPLAAAATDAPIIVLDPLAHSSSLAVAKSLTRRGGQVRLAPVDAQGQVDESLLAELADGCDVVVITHGQAEVGTIRHGSALIVAILLVAPDALVVIDAEETAGLVDVTDGLGADLVVVGGRSLGGPAWAGALVIRPGTHLHPLLEGGLEEGGKRGGAHDIPAIVGLGVAADEALNDRSTRVAHMRAAASRLTDGLRGVPGVTLNGPPPDERLPGHVQVSVRGVEAEALALSLAARDVAVAPGSACTFGAGKASPVLAAMGHDDETARSAVLLTAGPTTTDTEIDAAIRAFTQSVVALRAMAP